MRSISLTLASILFFVSFLGACLAFTMEHDMPMTGDCLYITGRSMVCPIGLGERLDAWKGALIAQPMKFFTGSVAIVFLMIAFFASSILLAARTSPKRIWREWILLSLFLPLRRAFARGILHPKVY
jgi:hypothetical protein